jgi:hypothetical protein
MLYVEIDLRIQWIWKSVEGDGCQDFNHGYYTTKYFHSFRQTIEESK